MDSLQDHLPDSLLGLPENVLLALLLVFAVGQVSERISQRWERTGDLTNGILFGLAAILCMSVPFEPQPGVWLDMRNLVVLLAGPFAGPVAASVAAVLVGAVRIYLGGAGVVAELGSLVTSVVLGSLIWKFYGRLSNWRAAALAGLALSVTTLPWFLTVGTEAGWALIRSNGPSLTLFYMIGAVAIARLLTARERRGSLTRELNENVRRLRDLTHLAFDWEWEMGPDLRITKVTRVGQWTHFTPRDLVGKRYDELLADATERNRKKQEARLEEHEPVRDLVLTVSTAAGEERHLTISGKPVFDDKGAFAGYRGSGRDVTEETRARDELLREASTDWLTGTMNRRSIDALLAAEVERVRRYNRTMSIVLFDIDSFKEINDNHGHAAGDAALRAVTETVANRLRMNDMLGRLGGDEFMILLPETNAAGAAAAAEDIRAQVERMTFDKGLRVTLSIGGAEYGRGAGPVELMNAADAALYVAKGRGKNCVAVAGERARAPSAETATATAGGSA